MHIFCPRPEIYIRNHHLNHKNMNLFYRYIQKVLFLCHHNYKASNVESCNVQCCIGHIYPPRNLLDIYTCQYPDHIVPRLIPLDDRSNICNLCIDRETTFLESIVHRPNLQSRRGIHIYRYLDHIYDLACYKENILQKKSSH